jgi:hypothetical protein
MVPQCSHLDSIRDVTPNTTGCHVGCCDSSKNRHATHLEAAAIHGDWDRHVLEYKKAGK